MLESCRKSGTPYIRPLVAIEKIVLDRLLQLVYYATTERITNNAGYN